MSKLVGISDRDAIQFKKVAQSATVGMDAKLAKSFESVVAANRAFHETYKKTPYSRSDLKTVAKGTGIIIGSPLGLGAVAELASISTAAMPWLGIVILPVCFYFGIKIMVDKEDENDKTFFDKLSPLEKACLNTLREFNKLSSEAESKVKHSVDMFFSRHYALKMDMGMPQVQVTCQSVAIKTELLATIIEDVDCSKWIKFAAIKLRTNYMENCISIIQEMKRLGGSESKHLLKLVDTLKSKKYKLKDFGKLPDTPSAKTMLQEWKDKHTRYEP